MNKSALRTFAIDARNELLERVELQARKIGITKDKIEDASFESSDAAFINGKQLTDVERKQRNKLINRINDIGFDQVMEETAYTWFNRFVALRFMEVNDYLPTKVRVLSSETEGSTEPDMIKEALSLDLPIDKEYIYQLKIDNNTEELFKYLIKLHCNDLNRYMSFMFETIEDYTAILFPEGLLGTDSFVQEMIDTDKIPEEDWQQVEIIGWLYQYYIAEEKDRVFANLKKNLKVTKETLPAATQLFTPHWIVRYMVENSLGRIWLESYPDSSLKTNWKYYLDEAEQAEDTIRELEDIRYKNVNPEELTFLDPACGSGHILVYAFDVFYEMYLEQGYMESEIPKLILEKNLYGLDVDDRAIQLASFAIVMKAREKSRRVFRQEIELNICAIQESNWLNDDMIASISENKDHISTLKLIRDSFIDAKEYGAVLDIELSNLDLLEIRFNEYIKKQADLVEMINKLKIKKNLPLLLKQSSVLNRTYDVVCTNPPYMGSRSMNQKLSNFLKKHYPDTRSDLSTVFMEKSMHFCKPAGRIAMINIPVWMFIRSYLILREHLIAKKTIINMLHLGRGVFGSDFGTTAFVLNNTYVNSYKATYRKLYQKHGSVDSINQKKEWFFENFGFFTAVQNDFLKIPGFPIAYWASMQQKKVFEQGISLNQIAEPKQGLSTADNNRFLRFWHEVDYYKIGFNFNNSHEAQNSGLKWFPFNKGGNFRKWYGNNEYLINWENDGKDLKEFKKSVIRNPDYYFKESITWTLISSSSFGCRYSKEGFIFDAAGSSLFVGNDLYYILGLMTSKLSHEFLKIINPTLNFSNGVIGNLPFIDNDEKKNEINELVSNSIDISKYDWDAFEISWDFTKHPLLKYPSQTVGLSFNQWGEFTESQFTQLKQNEEELNRIFIDIYGLQDELTPEVDDKDVTVSKADLKRDIKSFISYAVGCTFGRYSLDEEGLIYAGGEFDPSRYQTFPADNNNILPILPGAYFEDDIVTRLINFVKVTYGEDTLEENLNFVADAIGRRKNETARETLRRYFLNNFYKDHVQTYKKRPIYWLFTSGKERAFNCLIYMHRYDKTTLSRIRTDYLHDVQVRYESEKKDLLSTIEDEGNATAKEIRDAKKELTSIEKKIEELKAYDEKLHHLADMQIEIDLDDGVKVNYEKFEGLVAKI